MQTSTATSTRPIFGPTHAALTATALLWSSNFVIGRAIHEAVTPATMNFLRWAIALMVLTPLTLVDLRRHRAVLLRHWKLVALLGLSPASRRSRRSAMSRSSRPRR
jgi:drug/metabolite transporter (DMT)-like permease